MTEHLENQKEESSSAEDVKPQRLLLLEQLLTKAEQSIPEVDDFLSEIMTKYGLDITPTCMEFLKLEKFLEVWLCLIISQRLTKENSLIFEDGTCFTKQQLELIYGIDFANAFVAFLSSLQPFSQTELKLFTTSVVLSETYSEALLVGRTYFFDEADKKPQILKDFCLGFFDIDISQKLLSLRALIEQHNSIIEEFCRNYWPKLDISGLIALRLDIPISTYMRTACSADLSGAISVEEISEEVKINSWNRWAKILTTYMKIPISFAQACLESLTKRDQACLLKHGLIETWFCIVPHFMNVDGTLPENRQVGYTRNNLIRLYGLDFTEALMETSLSLQPYLGSELEMQLFQNIVLLSQRPGLVDVEAVQKLQDREIEKFRAEKLKNANYSDNSPLDIPQMLKKLQSLSLLHSNSLDWLKENSLKAKPTHFFCQVFDIPNFILEKTRNTIV